MAEAETATEGEVGNEERQTHAWASQTPETRVSGVPKEIIYSGDITDTPNDPSFGIVLSRPEVEIGGLFKNQVKPEDGTTADGIDEDQSRPTDYRVADVEDSGTTIANGSLVTGEGGPNVYDESGSFEDEEIIVWYNGMSGERIGRVLDFNGRPFVRYTDDGYLIKGLFQVVDEWRGADGSTRSRLKEEGKGPRVARYPILRDDAERVLIDVTRYRGGRGYELHVFDADAFEDEFGSLDFPTDQIDRDDYYRLEADSEFEMPYTEDADDFLTAYIEENEIDVDGPDNLMFLETGDGWGEIPEGANSGTGSFAVDVDVGSDEEINSQHEEFAAMVASELPDGMTPDEAYTGGVEGLIGRNTDAFHVVPEASKIRSLIYEEVAWLDPDDLD